MQGISIIIPAYNAEKTIGRCIDSAIAQTYPDLEIIIIDDGSTDHTLENCRKYEQDSDKVKVFSKKNGGVSAARNYGIQKATRDYILFMDSDDYMKPGMCNDFIENMSQECDLLVCGYESLTKDGRYETLVKNEYIGKAFTPKTCFYMMLLDGFLHPVWNKLFRREKIVHFFNEQESMGEDVEFVLDYMKESRAIKFIKKPLYVHDLATEGSLTKKWNLIIPAITNNQAVLNNYVTSIGLPRETMDEYFIKRLWGTLRDMIYEDNIVLPYSVASGKLEGVLKEERLQKMIQGLELETRLSRLYQKVLKGKHVTLVYLLLISYHLVKGHSR
ncbi:MAG: glycosyltransferase family 2 protein [Lachnospiraceae bacterium]|nr:glycosyltransferase family 2 protein [Lachnospiraceae bacterium]